MYSIKLNGKIYMLKKENKNICTVHTEINTAKPIKSFSTRTHTHLFIKICVHVVFRSNGQRSLHDNYFDCSILFST